MAAQYVDEFIIHHAEDFDDLIEAIDDQLVSAVLVDVPSHSEAFRSVSEFRQLHDAARVAGVELELTSDDPLRRELAQIIGITVRQPGANTSPPPPASEDKTIRIIRDHPRAGGTAKAESDAETVAALPSIELDAEREPVQHTANDPLADGSYSFVIHPPTTRRHDTTRPILAPTPADEPVESFEQWASRHRDTARREAQKRRQRRGRPLALASLALGGVVVAALLAMLLVPSATFAVTPAQSDISTTLTYGVARAGATYDITIEPNLVSKTLTFQGSIATTGERLEPDGIAAGVLQLTNATTREVAVPAGTILTSPIGVAYETLADVVVPAADPYGSLTIGSANVDIQAVDAGSTGNIEAESMYGQIDSGIYFLNRAALAGGSERTIATVAQADVDALQAQAAAALEQMIPGALQSAVATDALLLDGTEQRSDISTKLDHAVGEDATTLNVTGEVTLTGQSYRMADVHTKAKAEVERRLEAQTGTQFAMLPNSLRTTDPIPVPGTGNTAFSITASGTARAVIDQDELNKVADETSGRTSSDARALMSTVPGVAEVALEQSPSWLSQRLPRLGSRIHVEVIDATSVQTEAQTTRP